jgi:hypothetical protein
MADRVDLARSRAWLACRRAARRYEQTNNPLFAWEAAALALGAGMPLPEAVQAYLVRIAQRLGAPPGGRITRPAQHVVRCLELGGRGPSAFDRRRRFERDLVVAHAAAALHRNIGLLRRDALQRAGEDAGRDAESLERQARRRTNVVDSRPTGPR